MLFGAGVLLNKTVRDNLRIKGAKDASIVSVLKCIRIILRLILSALHSERDTLRKHQFEA